MDKYRIGSMVIVEQKEKEFVVLLTSIDRGLWSGTVPVINRPARGFDFQIKTVIRY